MKQMTRFHKILDLFGRRLKLNSDNKFELDNEEIGGGTNVEANPTLDGTEADLTGLQVGETKYKVPNPTVKLYEHSYGFVATDTNKAFRFRLNFLSTQSTEYDLDTLMVYLNGKSFAINPVYSTGNTTSGTIHYIIQVKVETTKFKFTEGTANITNGAFSSLPSTQNTSFELAKAKITLNQYDEKSILEVL